MSIESMKLQRDVIALEFINLHSTKEYLKNIIPSFLDEMSGILSKFQSIQTEPAIQNNLSSKQTKFIKTLSQQPYSNIRELSIYVPEGFKGNLLEYSNLLLTYISIPEALLKELDEYSVFLSNISSNQNSQMSTDYNKKLYEDLHKEMVKIKKSFTEFFKDSNHQVEVKYKDVFNNNNEFSKAIEHTAELVKRIENINRSFIIKKVANISELISLINKRNKEDKLSAMSDEMVTKLSDYTYTMAERIEFFSVLFYRIRSLSSVLDQNIEKITNLG